MPGSSRARTTYPAPSPRFSPARVASNGRHRSGSRIESELNPLSVKRHSASALAIGHGLRYGNPGFAEPIPELGLRPVAETESAAVNSVLSNSFGFGGNCSSLIFAK